MIDIKIAMIIGDFEMKPKADICKDCPRCDLEIQTREYHYLDKPKAMEVIGICKHADACRGVVDYYIRQKGEENGKS